MSNNFQNTVIKLIIINLLFPLFKIFGYIKKVWDNNNNFKRQLNIGTKIAA